MSKNENIGISGHLRKKTTELEVTRVLKSAKYWRLLVPVPVVMAFLMFGTGAFAQDLPTGPWKYGKIIGTYVHKVYGPGKKLPGNFTVASKSVVITATSLNVRNGPGTTYKVIATVKKGMVLKVLRQTTGWYNVVLPDGRNGWVAAGYVTVKNLNQPNPQVPKPETPGADLGTPTEKHGVVKGGIVNVRSGPGTTYPVAAKVTNGTRVRITRETAEWYKVTLPDGKEGWIAKYLVLVENQVPSRGDTPGTGNSGGDIPGEAGRLTEVRVESVGEQDIVTVNADATITYTVYVLAEPYRLVIDLNNMKKDDLPESFAGTGKWVQGVRLSQYSLEPLKARLVIDLARYLSYKVKYAEDKKSIRIEILEPSIKGKTIVIDPGHGGYDPGAIGVTGLREKDYNLDTALRVYNLLKELGTNPIITRDTDTFIALTDRAAIANNAQADVFVSIHANSSENASLNGTSTYYYAPESDPVLYAQADARRKLAVKVQAQLAANLGIKDLGIKTANFSVLRNTGMPSILVESAFLSNKTEEALLKDSGFRDKVARAIVDGLVAYFTEP
ncbi:N-acetylmuramoyl-L-alanine amidase [Thermincola ferriacetica]